ncbi:MAG: type II secretion system F family protein [Nanoarchaeota archaeon]|nr:type II secretion system F family protein [Nanoarchaeota archaeon]
MIAFFQSVPLQERINFARHLHLMIKSGVSLPEGLRLLAEQTPSRSLRRIIQGFIAEINKGRFLSEGLRGHGKIFGDFFVSIVEIGERSGNLSESLLYLAEELEKKKSLQGKVKTALIYPVIILCATVGIVLFLVFFVLPKILPLLTDLRVALPLPTRMLIVFVDVASAYWFLILPLFFMLPVAVHLLLRVKSIRLLYDRALLFTPVIRGVVVGVVIVDFTRSFALLMRSGVAILEALEVSARSLRNTAYRAEIEHAIGYVRRGEQLSSYLRTRRGFFPPMVANLISVGETTGNLEQNLFYLAEYYEREVDERVKNLTATLEPLLLLFMGLLVGFVAISIILPIYQVSTPNL